MSANTLPIDSRISEIIESWFIREPIMMLVILTHELVVNSGIKSFRCGRGRIEYNPKFSLLLSKEQLEERLKVEVIRILLNHPYRYHDNKMIALLASNITLNENYRFKELFPRASDFWQEKKYYNQNFEFYVREVQSFLKLNGNADHFHSLYGSYEEKTTLWQENELIASKIKEIVVDVGSDTTQWGSIPASLQQVVIANLEPKVDYRNIIKSFRTSILSSSQIGTRFKPSRRYRWLALGKKLDFSTHLLIAIDVSGSITDNDLRSFYAVVNRFFKFGLKQLSVIQFDTEIKGEPVIFTKPKRKNTVSGRGGTDFQPVVDYFVQNRKQYDGLLIFTDGFAHPPKIPKKLRRNILFLCNSFQNFEHHKDWMKKVAKVAWVEREE